LLRRIDTGAAIIVAGFWGKVEQMIKTEHRESSMRDLFHADAAGRTAASQLSGSRRSPHWGRSLIPSRMGFR
jgi:hypothetical protein